MFCFAMPNNPRRKKFSHSCSKRVHCLRFDQEIIEQKMSDGSVVKFGWRQTDHNEDKRMKIPF